MQISADAPEDQNGLREALADKICDTIAASLDVRVPGRLRNHVRQALASLIAERDAAVADRNSARAIVREFAKAHVIISETAHEEEARARAAEAEITRLKEGMEAAPTEAEFHAAEEAVMAEWAVMREQLRAPHINWPVSPTNWRILRAGWTAIAKARATLSQEHPHG